MRTNVQRIDADATILDAVTTMADGRISGLPVVDGGGRVIGVITSTDILQAEAEQEDARARNQLFVNTTVRDLMTTTPQLIAPDDDVRDAARNMLYADVRRLFVAEKGKLVGVISQTDIAQAVATGRL
jgi:CBS domain-containing protein